MAIAPCSRVSWVLLLFTAISTSSVTQAEMFPGYINHYPSSHYVIKGQDFNTMCTVVLSDPDIQVQVSFKWRRWSSSNVNVTLTSTKDGNVLIGKLTIRNPVFSNVEELMCCATGFVGRKLTNISKTSTIYSLVAPFTVISFPGEELQLDSDNPYVLKCIVKVDHQFPLEAVSVLIQYSAISLDNDNMPSKIYNNKQININSRTLTVTVTIQDIEQKFGGVFACIATTKQIGNTTVPQYSVKNRTRIVRAVTDPTSSGNNDNSDKNLIMLSSVFSGVTIILLMVFTILVFAVIWTKRHRSKNFPVSPYSGTIPTTHAKSNYYSDTPAVSAVNKVPAVALHITPRLQSTSSVETDV